MFTAKLLEYSRIHRYFLTFTIIYFLLSFLTYKDWGITYDEQVEYDAGRYLSTYYATPSSASYLDKLINNGPINIETRHLPPFSVYSRIYPMLLSTINAKQYMEWFHLLNLLFGYVLFLTCYLVFKTSGFTSNKACFASVILFLTPYILGHIPANPKDIPFAWSYLLGLFFILYFSKNHSNEKAKMLILGLTFGFSSSLRMVGVTLFLINFLYDIYKKRQNIGEIVLTNTTIFLTGAFVMIIAAPFLGLNFLQNFKNLIFNAVAYNDWRGQVLYLGKLFSKEERPWHYLFVLSAVKLPLTTVFFTLCGLFIAGQKIVKKKLSDFEVVFLLAIIINIVLYLIAHPVVYNGLRHFLYLLCVLTIFSTYYLLKSCEKYKGVKIAVCIYLVFTFARMVVLHPYEYVYFNEATLGLKGADKLFETDYWGASYKSATDFVLDYSKSYRPRILNVFACDSRFAVDYYSKMRYKLVGSPKEADILICDTFNNGSRKLTQPVIYEVKREGVVLNQVMIQKDFK